MTDSDSSFEGEIEKMSSEKEETYNTVPRDVLFTFKFKAINGKTYKMTQYTLLKGKTLPYIAVCKGLYFCSQAFYWAFTFISCFGYK